MSETQNYVFNDFIGDLHATTNLIVSGSSDDSGNSGDIQYTVTYNPGKHGKIASGMINESVIRGNYPKNPPTISAESGYEFTGWSAKENGEILDLSKQAITANLTYYAIYKEIAGDIAKINQNYLGAYLKGYTDKTFKPDNNMTRAEFASMLSNILTIPKNSKTTTFADVSSDKWYAEAVNLVAGIGVIKGYDDGLFRPEQNITRAEATSLLMRCANNLSKTNSNTQLSDINAHWAYNDIIKAIDGNIIDGYPDGTFRPNDYISRAEVAKITNKLLGREPLNDELLNKFIDLKPSHWAFGDIIAATNGKSVVIDA